MPFAPGIWNDEQMQGWKKVVKAVHQEHGKIVLQLWHMGRVVHSSFMEGAKPVSASATTSPGHGHTYLGNREYETARALSVDEIGAIVKQYGIAARNAMDVGFDGVQIHGANGYLIDQFLRTTPTPARISMVAASRIASASYPKSPRRSSRLWVQSKWA